MSEVTSTLAVTQVKAETTHGTWVAPDARLLATSIEPAIKAEIQGFRPMGQKFQTIAALGKEWVEAGISGTLCYNDITHLLCSLLKTSTASLVSGASATYDWTFEPSAAAEDTVTTFSVEHGSSARAGKFAYGLVTDLALHFSRDECTIDGTMIGQAYSDGATLTTGCTEIAVVPVVPTTVDIFMDSTGSGIGTTRLSRVLKADLSIGGRYGQVWPLDSTVSGFAAHTDLAPEATLTLLMEADAAGMGILTAMRAGTSKFIRIKATGPVTESTLTHGLTIDLCGQVSDVGKFSDEDGVYAIEYTFNVAYDATWTKALSIVVRNMLSKLGK